MDTLNTTKKDWHKAYIKAALEVRCWTLRKLSAARGYSPQTLRLALWKPYPKAEAIIAEAIGVKPWEIWPSRYDEHGRPNRPMGRRPYKHRIEKNNPKSNGKEKK